MFDRLQKPFLTVETGEAYQPLRLSYHLHNKQSLIDSLNKLKCLTKSPQGDTWNWYWRDEVEDLHFESLDSFKRTPDHPVRLGSLLLKGDTFYISMPSFKRACLAVPFFHKSIAKEAAQIHHVDFINKVFAIDEKLPHGFTELFKEDELEKILQKRLEDYHEMQDLCGKAPTAEEAFNILKNYTAAEAQKRLPYAERYVFDFNVQPDPEIVFLSFYIFLRGRELVAIKRWFGETNYTLADVVDDTLEQVFGGMDIDILE